MVCLFIQRQFNIHKLCKSNFMQHLFLFIEILQNGKQMNLDDLMKTVRDSLDWLKWSEERSAKFTKYLVNTDGIHPDLYKACSEYKMQLETVLNDEKVFAILMQLPEAIAEKNQEDIDFYVDLAESLETEILPFLPQSI